MLLLSVGKQNILLFLDLFNRYINELQDKPIEYSGNLSLNFKEGGQLNVCL